MSSDKKSNHSGSGSGIGSVQGRRAATKTLKGTFGHMNSRIDHKLISLDRTISAESSDLRRYIVATTTEIDNQIVDEFNSVASASSCGAGYKDKLKDSGVDDANSSSLDDSAVALGEFKPPPTANRLVYDFCDSDDDDDGDELSSGCFGTACVLDDLPSGIVDVDGTLIVDGKLHVRFGQEDDDDNDNDSDGNEDGHNLRETVSREFPLKDTSTNGSNPAVLKSPTPSASSNSTPSSSRKMFTKLFRGRSSDGHTVPILPLSPTKQLRHDFRNPYGGGGGVGGTDDMVLRKHAGGTVRHKALMQMQMPMPGADGRAARKDSSGGATITSASTLNSTITQHYYPESGWGYMVLFTACVTHTLLCGLLLSSGIVTLHVCRIFRYENSREHIASQHAVWLGVSSLGLSLLLSPVWVAICKRKSTRLVAVFGGLLISLGCLFTSFASQFHQLYVSYTLFIGIGFGLTRDASSLMVGQYFKRKRDLVEIVLVSSSGLGLAVMSEAIHAAISSLGWRLGLEALTGFIFLTFFLGTCYRSASLYHPQRRAILHLKNQKRKVKEKEKRDEKPPFLDFGCLRSKTVQILLISAALVAVGIYTPLFHLGFHYLEPPTSVSDSISQYRQQRLQTNDSTSEGSGSRNSVVVLFSAIGGSWIAGSVLFGLIVLQKNQECRVSKQYLCQIVGTICGVSILALTAVEEASGPTATAATSSTFNGLLMFACIYGFSLGGYNYILKVYTYERVRARHFPRAWSFVQAAQAIPFIVGVPLSGYLNSVDRNYGYYLAASSVFLGSVFLFVTDFHKKTLARRKTLNSSTKTSDTRTCSTTQESVQSPNSSRRISFAFPADGCSPEPKSNSSHHSHQSHSHYSDHTPRNVNGNDEDPALAIEKELTCISEEGIADMDFQDVNYDEWNEYFGDCITSCNKVELEDCLISEFDPEHPMLQGGRRIPGKRTDICSDKYKRSKRYLLKSAAESDRSKSGIIGTAAVAIVSGVAGLSIQAKSKPDSTIRSISTIEEAEDST